MVMSQRVLRVVLACLVAALVGGTVAAFAFASSSKVVASRAAPTAVTVWAGPGFLKGPPPGLSRQAEALAFFPRVVTVAAGQPVTFQFAGFHTVTFTGGKAPGEVIAPRKGAQPLLKDSAGQPLWWSGKAPLLGLNPLAVPQQGGGTISSPSQVRSSGLLRILISGPKTPPKGLSRLKGPGG